MKTIELFGTAMLVVLAIAGINYGVHELFGYNIITSLLPKYARWIYIGFGLVGAFVLYGVFSKK